MDTYTINSNHNILATMAQLNARMAELESRERLLVESERRQHMSWRRLRKAEAVSHLGSWEIDIATGESVWSDEFYHICGLVPGEIRATTEEGFKLIHRDDRARAARELARAKGTGDGYSIEMRIVRPDGEIRHVQWIGEFLLDGAGVPERLMGAFHDITRRNVAEEGFRQSLAKLKQSNDELDAYATTVAHDLRNPLGVILGFSQLIEESVDDHTSEDISSSIALIVQSSHTMLHILDELLLLARVRSLEEMKIGPLMMGAITADVITQLNAMIGEKQAIVQLPEKWPVAFGYAPWIEAVWTHFLTNALKFGGAPPCIEFGADEEESLVRFWIRDNGQGLTPERQSRMFIEFSDVHERSVAGHGLGLSIVRRIVEKLGGAVGVKSEVGKGSEFYFTLPRRE